MTEILAFAERHPVLTTIWLLIICAGIHGLIRIRIGKGG